MVPLLHQRIRIVDFVAILVGAALAGHAAGTLVLAGLRRSSPESLSLFAESGFVQPPVSSSEGGALVEAVQAIVRRNVFCSDCDGGPPAFAAPPRPPRLGAFRLLAVMFAPAAADERWSIVVVRDDVTAKVGAYAVGDRLGDGVVLAIMPARVLLDLGGGQTAILELLGARTSATSSASGDRAAREGAVLTGVKRIAPRRYEVQRAAVEQMLAGGFTGRWPRVVPQTRDGQTSGLRLAGVGADGPFAEIGLLEGDVLEEVNGRSIATPAAGLAAYTTLREASHVWLVLERHGERVRLDYDVR